MDGMSAIMVAAREGHEACVQVLVAAGVQVADCSCMCMTALHFAALAGSCSMVKQLLTAGARVDARNARGATAGMLAAEEWLCAVVEELLHSGADPSLRDRFGSSLVTFAQRKGTWAALRKLWNAVPAPDDERRPCTPLLQKTSKLWESPQSAGVRRDKQEEEDPRDKILFADVDVLLMP
jgi:uncharacterized protein